MRRQKIGNKKSKRMFSKTASRVHGRNISSVPRGGLRL